MNTINHCSLLLFKEFSEKFTFHGTSQKGPDARRTQESQPEHTQIVCEDCDSCVQRCRWTFLRGS